MLIYYQWHRKSANNLYRKQYCNVYQNIKHTQAKYQQFCCQKQKLQDNAATVPRYIRMLLYTIVLFVKAYHCKQSQCLLTRNWINYGCPFEASIMQSFKNDEVLKSKIKSMK